MKKEKAHEVFKRFLKNGKNRVTPERFEVLDAALDYKGHFGADELYIAMKNHKSNVSRATVYNTLELLTQCDLFAKRNFGDNTTRYESKFGRKNHEHLVCINCGKITEFVSPEIQQIVDSICEKYGYENAGHSFNIFGKCNKKDCEYFHGSY